MTRLWFVLLLAFAGCTQSTQSHAIDLIYWQDAIETSPSLVFFGVVEVGETAEVHMSVKNRRTGVSGQLETSAQLVGDTDFLSGPSELDEFTLMPGDHVSWPVVFEPGLPGWQRAHAVFVFDHAGVCHAAVHEVVAGAAVPWASADTDAVLLSQAADDSRNGSFQIRNESLIPIDVGIEPANEAYVVVPSQAVIEIGGDLEVDITASGLGAGHEGLLTLSWGQHVQDLAVYVEDGAPSTVDDDEDQDGLTVLEGDCDDTDPEVHPGATEHDDDKDQDCDGLIDEWPVDRDKDGFSEADGDCDDFNGNVHPAAKEYPNQHDDDCDGEVDEEESWSFSDSCGELGR